MALYQEYNIEAYKGDTFSGVQFTVNVNGSPLNLTDAIIKVDFRQGSETGKIIKTIGTIEGGITITNAIGGIFQIDSFLCELMAYSYYYDIQLSYSGITKTYIRGRFTVIQDITTNG